MLTDPGKLGCKLFALLHASRKLLLRGGKLLLKLGDALALALVEPALAQRAGRRVGGAGGGHSGVTMTLRCNEVYAR